MLICLEFSHRIFNTSHLGLFDTATKLIATVKVIGCEGNQRFRISYVAQTVYTINKNKNYIIQNVISFKLFDKNTMTVYFGILRNLVSVLRKVFLEQETTSTKHTHPPVVSTCKFYLVSQRNWVNIQRTTQWTRQNFKHS